MTIRKLLKSLREQIFDAGSGSYCAVGGQYELADGRTVEVAHYECTDGSILLGAYVYRVGTYPELNSARWRDL